MAVLIEELSVVIRRDAIERCVQGGWKAVDARAPSLTMCTDEELARFGFREPFAVQAFTQQLTAWGLVHLHDGQAKDFVVVDQIRGPTSPNDWCEFFRGAVQGHLVMMCRLRGSRVSDVAVPAWWEYENSPSARHVLVDAAEPGWELIEDGELFSVYLDRAQNRRCYVSKRKLTQ